MWLGSCLERLARDGDDRVPLPPMDTVHPLISTLGVGLEDGLLPSFLLLLRSSSFTESCLQAQIPGTARDRKGSVDQLRPLTLESLLLPLGGLPQ